MPKTRASPSLGVCLPPRPPPRGGTGPDGAGGAMAVRLAVGLGAAAEAVALHHAGETTALRRPAHVYQVAGLEDLRPHLLTHSPLADVVHRELAQVAEGAQPLEVTL